MARIATIWPTLAIAIALPVLATSTSQAADPQGCTAAERSNHALTDGAASTGAVICPPDVDLAMKQPTPSTGDRPVVPAPGTSGGDREVPPKRCPCGPHTGHRNDCRTPSVRDPDDTG